MTWNRLKVIRLYQWITVKLKIKLMKIKLKKLCEVISFNTDNTPYYWPILEH